MTEGWCPFLGGLGSWKLEQEGLLYQGGGHARATALSSLLE